MYTCTLYMVSCTLYTAQTPHAKIEGERIHVHLGEGILAIIYSIRNRRSRVFLYKMSYSPLQGSQIFQITGSVELLVVGQSTC